MTTPDLTNMFAKLTPEQSAEIRRRLAAKTEESDTQEPIAIIGMQCRFPGAANLDAFWKNLAAGVDSVGEIPTNRFDFARHFAEKVSSSGKMNTRWGGFLEKIDEFDHRFFGISEPEARNLDPQHRLLLEVAWEALEDAGFLTPGFTESNTGVFIGVSNRDYEEMLMPLEDPTCIDPYFGTGNALSVSAGRISHILGLHGPSVAIDTACSSSLSAVHLACQSLRTRECTAALAGGVNLLLTPTGFIYGSQLSAMSPTGRVRSFSAEADGYVRGEGCGIVVLKRMKDALRDQDRILAVIRSSVMNHDGRASSLTAPNVHAQTRLLRTAWRLAGIEAAEIGYIEAHGSGTPLGDPIEATAIANALNGRTDPVLVGSVKSNIGHLEPAAGIAGLIKVVLCLKYRQLVPSLHVREVNPHLRDLPIDVSRSVQPWSAERRLAGVSSFGIGGTNVHAVVEEWIGKGNETNEKRAELLLLSAGEEEGRRDLVKRWEQHLAREDGDWTDETRTAAARRRHHRYRLAVVAESREEAAVKLASWPSEEGLDISEGQASDEVPLVFVYSGQGGQWKGMGRYLLKEEKSFADKVEAIDREVRQQFGWSIQEHLASGNEVEGERMEITQVALFTIQSGLTALWRSWGVEPVAAIGHSMGEVAAAEAAGILTLAEAVKIVGQRSRLLEGVAEGAMFACELDAEEAERWIEGSRIEIAAHNSHRWMVLSGPREDAERMAARIEQTGRTVRWFKTTGMAGHSCQVDEASQRLREFLGNRKGKNSTIRMVSTITGDWVHGEELDANYWAANLRRRVRFVDGMNRLLDAGYQCYLEVGPHPMLSTAIVEAAAERQRNVKVMASMKREQGRRKDLLETAGWLWTWGQRLRWENVLGPVRVPVPLPAYPWQRSRFWYNSQRLSASKESIWILERDLVTDHNLSKLVSSLIDRWPTEGARAINRAEMAPYIFLPSSCNGLLFCGQTNQSITVFLYAGPSEAYISIIREAHIYARRQGWALNVMALENEASALAADGYSTTPVGLLQSLDDLDKFNLNGASKRRLRYARERYAQAGDVKTAECDASSVEELIALIDAWCRHKGQTPAFVQNLKIRLRERRIELSSRIFITRRNGEAECAVFLSPAPMRSGYLMDLEFYGADLPLGGLEYTITSIIEKLQLENVDYFGLGGSYGTALESHPRADPDAATLLQSLHDSDVLNGDSNVQFKSKFRPLSQQIYLCRPSGTALSSVEDVLLSLGGRETEVENLPPSMKPLNLCSGTQIFETKLNAAAKRYFDGHRLEGNPVMPGAGLIDCMLQAARSLSGSQEISLREIVIERPLPLGEQSQTIQVAISESGDVQLYSNNGEWRRHCSAKLCHERSNPGARFDSRVGLPRLAASQVDEFYANARRSGAEYADEFRVLRKLWIGDGEGVGWIGSALSSGIVNGSCVCPPAMLDSAFQVLAATVSAFDGGMVLMRGAQSIRVFRPWPAAVWCYARIASGSGSETLLGDLNVYDITGEAVAEIDGVQAERLDNSRDAAILHVPTWVETSLKDGRANHDWIVMGGSHREVEILRSAGERVHHVQIESLNRILDDLSGPATVVYIFPRSNEEAPLRARSSCQAALSLAQKLLRRDQPGIRLRLVTRNAQSVAGAECDPGQTAVWGFSRSFAAEHPELMAGLADIGDSSYDILTLARWLQNDNGFSQVAIRNAKLYSLRIDVQPETRQKLAVSPDATYLIAGGFRGLGLATAKYLAEQGARHIVLTGRGEAPAEAAAVLRQANISPHLMTADVTDINVMRQLMSWISENLPPLRGIVHAAVSIADASVATADWAGFEEAFRPKIDGAWNLHQLTRGCELDFFLLYSSAASMLGPAGQSGYAAANAFLDGLAAYRTARGERACSIGWGPWATIGRATNQILLQRLRSEGITPFETAINLEILQQIHSPYTLALSVDWRKFTQKHPFLRSAVQFDSRSNLVTQPEKRTREKRIADLTTYMRTKVADLLGVGLTSVSENHSLRSLGIDSLSSIVLRNRIEADAGVRIPIVKILAAERLSDVTTALGVALEEVGHSVQEIGHSVVNSAITKLPYSSYK